MEPENDQDQVREAQQRMVVVWGALLTSQFIFLMVLYLIKKELFHVDLSQPLGGKNPLMVAIAAVMSLTTLGLSFALQARMFKQAEADQDIAVVQTALIVSCALCESISLVGFILAMLIDYQYFFIWFAAGILGILLHFPRRKNIERAHYKHEL